MIRRFLSAYPVQHTLVIDGEPAREVIARERLLRLNAQLLRDSRPLLCGALVFGSALVLVAAVAFVEGLG